MVLPSSMPKLTYAQVKQILLFTKISDHNFTFCTYKCIGLTAP